MSLKSDFRSRRNDFGRGAPEGVAGPEAANNAAAQTCFIPLLALGLPPNAVMALMLGALTIQGIVPGPRGFTKAPDLFGMVASMWIGNLMLLVINLPLIGMWVTLLRVPYRLLYPAILLFCCIGLFSVNRLPADIYFMAAFGILGLLLTKLGFEIAPMLLGFVLVICSKRTSVAPSSCRMATGQVLSAARSPLFC